MCRQRKFVYFTRVTFVFLPFRCFFIGNETEWKTEVGRGKQRRKRCKETQHVLPRLAYSCRHRQDKLTVKCVAVLADFILENISMYFAFYTDDILSPNSCLPCSSLPTAHYLGMHNKTTNGLHRENPDSS